MVMQNLYIVYGRPSWSSKFLIATINTCGRFEPLKFELTSNGVCNNGVANVKCVAWTTPKGVTHDENGNRLHQNHHLPYVVQPLPYKWRLMRVGIAKTAASGVLCPNRCYVTVPPRSGALHTHRNCQWVCVPLKKMYEDADYVDVTEQVAKEISTQANKGTISFDDAVAPVSNEVPAGVDPETGEIKEPQGETSTENQASTEDDGPGY